MSGEKSIASGSQKLTGPKISVITVVRNSAATIETTIQSVLWQNYENYEYVIVDGMSTDGAWDIIRKYGDRIAVIVHEPDTGIYNAMNKAVARSSGDVLVFIGADDYLISPYVLARVAAVFQAAPGVDLVYGDHIIDWGTFQEARLHPDRLPRSYFLLDLGVNHQVLFARRRAFDQVGLFDESLAVTADRDWILRAVLAHGLPYRHVPLYICTYYAGGYSRQAAQTGVRELALLRARYFTRLERLSRPYYDFRRRLIYRWQHFNFRPPAFIRRLWGRP